MIQYHRTFTVYFIGRMKPAIYLQKNCCSSLIIIMLLEVKKNRDSLRLYYRKNQEKIIINGESISAPILVHENHHIIVHDLYAIIHYINNRSVVPILLPLDMQAKINMLMVIKLITQDVIAHKAPSMIKQQLQKHWSVIVPYLSYDGVFMLLDYLLYALSVFLVEENNFSIDVLPELAFILESLRDAYKIS
jgi:hypothetical protein